ncbi:membrane protein of unknown function [Nitrososphaera viennensis EN76]|uniref:Uncharacterized protein n=1 Tax=Nitrososphaera viennensis EN76 TaxID=926571 RepID=A0A060HLP2_9ARCH|nr:membrane protein of unknown function [Nitrososphaera viennensis EN76]
MPIFFVLRMLVPIFDKGMRDSPNQSEIKTFSEYRVHNITLATFSIVAIALILGFNPENISKHVDELFFLSISMFCFFVASYLLVIRPNRWIPFAGRTFEYTGLLAIAIGFVYLISNTIPDDRLVYSYIVFFIGTLAIAIFDLSVNIHARYFQK